MVMHKVKNLHLDMSVYPREQVDLEHVQRMVNSMQAGATFPPVVICLRTKRIADGAHRTRAALILYGADAEISCVEKVYANDAQLFLDGIRFNSGHGLVLSTADRIRALKMGENFNLSQALVSSALKLHIDNHAGLRINKNLLGESPAITANVGGRHHKKKAMAGPRNVLDTGTGWVLTDEKGKQVSLLFCKTKVALFGPANIDLHYDDIFKLIKWLQDSAKKISSEKGDKKP